MGIYPDTGSQVQVPAKEWDLSLLYFFIVGVFCSPKRLLRHAFPDDGPALHTSPASDLEGIRWDRLSSGPAYAVLPILALALYPPATLCFLLFVFFDKRIKNQAVVSNITHQRQYAGRGMLDRLLMVSIPHVTLLPRRHDLIIAKGGGFHFFMEDPMRIRPHDPCNKHCIVSTSLPLSAGT